MKINCSCEGKVDGCPKCKPYEPLVLRQMDRRTMILSAEKTALEKLVKDTLELDSIAVRGAPENAHNAPKLARIVERLVMAVNDAEKQRGKACLKKGCTCVYDTLFFALAEAEKIANE